MVYTDCSTDEDDKVSDLEIEEYRGRTYDRLQSGKYKLRNLDGSLRCPFCLRRKKQEYTRRGLMRHAYGVGRGSLKRSLKLRAKHRALANFIDTCLAKNLDEANWPQQPIAAVDASNEREELYCWPWSVIIMVNVETGLNSGDTSFGNGNLSEVLSKYKPVMVENFYNDLDQTAEAVVEFEGDWAGFKRAVELERYFLSCGRGRKDWTECKEVCSLDIYGWMAREDDFYSEGPLGEYLQRKSRLKSLCDVILEENQGKETVLNLGSKTKLQCEKMDMLLLKLNEKSTHVKQMLEEKDKLDQAFMEDTTKRQKCERDGILQILEQNRKMRNELEAKLKENGLHAWELGNRKAATKIKRRKLEKEKLQDGYTNTPLKTALTEQMKSQENISTLLVQQKRDYQEEMEWYLALQKQLEEQHKLEMEIAVLNGELEVMKHLGKSGDDSSRDTMKELTKKLLEKYDILIDFKSLDQVLINKEWEANIELQMAREVLIERLEEYSSSCQTNIGIKRLGEVEGKAFLAACKRRFKAEEAETKAAELTSSWQDKLKNSEWYPFIIVQVNGKPEEVIDKEDEELKNLRVEWGDEAQKAVIAAFKELKEYSPSGRCITKELWNFKEGRRATMKEVIRQILKNMEATDPSNVTRDVSSASNSFINQLC